MNRFWTACSVFAILFIGFSHILLAAEYSLNSSVALEAEHDDNIRLSVDNVQSRFGVTADVVTKTGVKAETWNALFKVRLALHDFSRSGHDSDDQSATFALNKRLERHSINLDSRYTRDSTRSSEEFESGRFSDIRRQSASLSPSWRYSVTERHSVSLNMTLSTVDYASDDYTGDDTFSSFIEWSYVASDTLSLFLRANQSRSETDGRKGTHQFIRTIPFEVSLVEQTFIIDNDSDGYQLGVQYYPVEQLSLFGLFGRTGVQSAYTVSDDEDVCELTAGELGFISRGICDLEGQSSRNGMTTARATWEEARFNIGVSYSLQSKTNSEGFLYEYETIDASWNYMISEADNLSLVATWSENETINVPKGQLSRDDNDREYLSISARYDHRLSDRWKLGFTYRYRWQQRESENSSANSNAVLINFTYQSQKNIW